MNYGGMYLTPLGILVNSICISLLLLYIGLKFSVTWLNIGNNPPPPLTTRYLKAIIYLVGFFSIFDFARQTLSVNGFTYMNVTNVVGWNNGLRCSSTFFHNFGLPCRHILYLSEKEKILLLVEEYKRRWRLNDTDEVKINQELL